MIVPAGWWLLLWAVLLTAFLQLVGTVVGLPIRIRVAFWFPLALIWLFLWFKGG